MALDTYANLQDAVARWLRRTNLTAAIPDFITLAETRFSREIRLRSMETSQAGTLSGNTLTVPSDLLKLQKITLTTDHDWDLEYYAPKNMPRFSGYTGQPKAFTTINQKIYLGPAPDSNTYNYTLNYIAKVPSLSNTNPTNTILQLAPDVYLYASLLEAAPYLKDDVRVELWGKAYANAVAMLIEQDNEQQFPDEALVVRSDVRL